MAGPYIHPQYADLQTTDMIQADAVIDRRRWKLLGFEFNLHDLRWSRILWLFEEVHVAFLNSLLRNLGQP